MRRDNGNVTGEEGPAVDRIEEFHEGDLVRLTQRALKDRKKAACSPRRLHAIGWPNLFGVERVVEFEREGLCLSLAPCCFNMIDHKSGEPLCKAHDAWMFEKVDLKRELEANIRPRQKGDRTAAIVTPLGEFVAAEYHDDPENPHFQVRIAGLPLDLEGGMAKWVKDVFVANGIFPKTE